MQLISPKDIERQRRDESKDIGKSFENVIPKTQCPCNWKLFLSNRTNNKYLITFLCTEFVEIAETFLLDGETFCVNGGYENGQTHVVFKTSPRVVSTKTPFYKSNHLEADTVVS